MKLSVFIGCLGWVSFFACLWYGLFAPATGYWGFVMGISFIIAGASSAQSAKP